MSGPARSTSTLVAPHAFARAAGLRYVDDGSRGIRRRRAGRGFVYLRPDGRPLRAAHQLRRIRRLAVPPAWTAVWICTDPRGHLQATGRDAKGRKQHRYHRRWREIRDEAKYDRLLTFGARLPALRRRVAADLRRPGLSRRKVVALAIRLLQVTLIRIGNEEYARRNRSFGLTTLRSHHVEASGAYLRFRFRGKSGRTHEVGLRDAALSRIVRRLQDLPGQELFCYLDEQGQPRPVGSTDINDYLREAMGEEFTAKDFRTWAGTVRAAWELYRGQPSASPPEAKRSLKRAIEGVARRLGNTPAICRKCYVHPAVADAHLDAGLRLPVPRSSRDRHLLPQEEAVLAFLRRESRAAVQAMRAAKRGTPRSDSNSGSMRARATVKARRPAAATSRQARDRSASPSSA